MNEHLAAAIAVFYARLLAGDSLRMLLRELSHHSESAWHWDSPCSVLAGEARNPETKSALFYRPTAIPDNSALLQIPVDSTSVVSVVTLEVQSVVAIDLHTHLLPPAHGALCLWGIDELLTYVRCHLSSPLFHRCIYISLKHYSLFFCSTTWSPSIS